jgi:hypothetical protein
MTSRDDDLDKTVIVPKVATPSPEGEINVDEQTVLISEDDEQTVLSSLEETVVDLDDTFLLSRGGYEEQDHTALQPRKPQKDLSDSSGDENDATVISERKSVFSEIDETVISARSSSATDPDEDQTLLIRSQQTSPLEDSDDTVLVQDLNREDIDQTVRVDKDLDKTTRVYRGQKKTEQDPKHSSPGSTQSFFKEPEVKSGSKAEFQRGNNLPSEPIERTDFSGDDEERIVLLSDVKEAQRQVSQKRKRKSVRLFVFLTMSAFAIGVGFALLVFLLTV